MVIIERVLSVGPKGLIVEQYHLQRIEDASRDVAVQDHHVDDLHHDGDLVQPVILAGDVEHHILQVDRVIDSYRDCQAQEGGILLLGQGDCQKD